MLRTSRGFLDVVLDMLSLSLNVVLRTSRASLSWRGVEYKLSLPLDVDWEFAKPFFFRGLSIFQDCFLMWSWEFPYLFFSWRGFLVLSRIFSCCGFVYTSCHSLGEVFSVFEVPSKILWGSKSPDILAFVLIVYHSFSFTHFGVYISELSLNGVAPLHQDFDVASSTYSSSLVMLCNEAVFTHWSLSIICLTSD